MYKLVFDLTAERRKPDIQRGYKRKWTLTVISCGILKRFVSEGCIGKLQSFSLPVLQHCTNILPLSSSFLRLSSTVCFLFPYCRDTEPPKCKKSFYEQK